MGEGVAVALAGADGAAGGAVGVDVRGGEGGVGGGVGVWVGERRCCVLVSLFAV